jgi:hypothetical protein
LSHALAAGSVFPHIPGYSQGQPGALPNAAQRDMARRFVPTNASRQNKATLSYKDSCDVRLA